MSSARPGRLRQAWARPEAKAFLELLALTGIAVAQPVLDVINNSPETIIGHQASGVAIVLATVVVVLVPALALWGLETVVRILNRRVGDWLHTGLLGFLAGVVAVEVAKRETPLRPSRLIVGGVVVALVAAALTRLSLVRLWLRYLAIAPLAFAVLFLSTSPVRALLTENQDTDRSADVAVRHPAPVVMIVLDEFPLMSLLDGQGRIDRSLYPNFAALADGANWYRNDTTVSPLTTSAVPAILTGRYPAGFGVAPTLANLPENVFTLLGHTYEEHASEVFTALCPRNLCQRSSRAIGAVGPLLGDAVDVFGRLASPSRSTTPLGFSGTGTGEPDAPTRVRAFIRSLGRSERPRLDFIHLMLPHGAWRYLPSGQHYDAPNPPKGFGFTSWGDDASTLAARQRHLLQVRYTDAVVGQVVARMKALGTYDKSLFIVTADHGAGFTGGSPSRGVSAANYEQILWTPLFVKLPGQTRGEVSDRQVRSIDVLPTIADVLGDQAALEGRRHVGASLPSRERHRPSPPLATGRPAGAESRRLPPPRRGRALRTCCARCPRVAAALTLLSTRSDGSEAWSASRSSSSHPRPPPRSPPGWTSPIAGPTWTRVPPRSRCTCRARSRPGSRWRWWSASTASSADGRRPSRSWPGASSVSATVGTSSP